MDSITSTATIDRNTSEFGPMVGISSALDCSIINLSPVVRDNDIKLNWKAVCSNNFFYFDVEYSTDGKSFTRLRTVNSIEFNKVSDYEFLHVKPGAGKHYYRLRMVNIASNEKYSFVVYAEIKSNGNDGLESMNSVFGSSIQVKVKAEKKEMMSLQLFNEQGKLVRVKEITGDIGINYIQIENTSSLSAGAYFLQLNREGEKSTRKIIKQ